MSSSPLVANFGAPPAVPLETPQPWASLVERIRAGDPSGMEELYGVFTTGIRFYLCRQLGSQDLDDKVHDAFLTITQSIRKGDVRLMGYVRTILRRQVAGYIGSAVEARRAWVDPDRGVNLRDRQPDPERRAMERQNVDLAMRVLTSLPWRDREVLMRFYLKEQSPRQICRDMGLTQTRARFALREGFTTPADTLVD